jgi:ATP-binding cassette subfamily F protein 3
MPKPNNQPTLIKLVEASLNFAQHTILDSITFEIKNKEVVGIVGRNGSGKSSFLKLLAKVDESDVGKLEYANETKLVYVGQDGNLASSEKTDFKQKQAVSENLSGGEKRQISLNEAFEIKPNILILDEPTNHLDFETVEALGLALAEFNGTIIFTSHDRTFANMLADGIIEINEGAVKRYHHGYEDYVAKLEKRLALTDALNIPDPEKKTISDYDQKKEAKKKIKNLETKLTKLNEQRAAIYQHFLDNPINYELSN